jgi:glycosyltransferase involved in cell wall biosynthesis
MDYMVTLLMLTYNEIDGMKAIMPQIDSSWYDELIIMDGGSTDGTLEYAREHGYPIFVQRQPGLGAAYLEGLAKATGDIVVTFSPDGNSDPSRIPDLVKKMNEGNDIVIVSRYREWAKSDDDDLVTGLGNWMFTMLYNVLYGQSVTDLLVIYRAFRKKLVAELSVEHQAIAWQTQLMTRAAKQDKKIAEIPGNEPARIGGARKMKPLRNGLAELYMLLWEFVVRG